MEVGDSFEAEMAVEQPEEKEPFEDLIAECKENTGKLEIIMIQKEHECQMLQKELSDLQDAIWSHQKEEYEQNSISTDQEIKKEIEELVRTLQEKMEKIEAMEKEINNKTAEGELVQMRAKYKETQQHKEIHIRRQYKAAMAGEQEIYPALRHQAEELKHELDSKRTTRDKLEEEIKKSEDVIKELRQLKREGASQEHELQEEMQSYVDR